MPRVRSAGPAAAAAATEAGPGAAVEKAPVNPADLALRAGEPDHYLAGDRSYVGGLELAGTIVATGPRSTWRTGERVAAMASFIATERGAQRLRHRRRGERGADPRRTVRGGGGGRADVGADRPAHRRPLRRGSRANDRHQRCGRRGWWLRVVARRRRGCSGRRDRAGEPS
ncbi:alcohol dehydrogenase catalytic domain-containing protein [Actinomadura physcomitrii]|uniref:alcohol dehydrogenase catalytic domain-containing protein n=1 Tax=Actinomadura physcomitrii TaxID=2650748 RepID=UPI0038B35E23